jgi:hypothetical protein
MKYPVKIFFKITVIVLTLLLTGGIHYVLIAGDRIHCELSHVKNGEPEVPDNHHMNTFADTEKWIGDASQPCSDEQIFSLSLYSGTTKPDEYTNSIWQPPRGF